METTKTVLTSGGRITVIDALRGFSLIGICLIHSMQHFGAMGTMTPQEMFPWEGTMNEIFRWCINYLVFGKFFIIFSCLFGLSFFIRLFARLVCPGGHPADICVAGLPFGVDV